MEKISREQSQRVALISYQVSNCRAGASPADPWNGKRERLPYKSVVRGQILEDTSSEHGARSSPRRVRPTTDRELRA